ncbi:MAG: hypothetical protein H0U76_06185 [Ktedonobacteraceae bacterium]|nr:hypothetical protein [Ktedonobacteraceae bacterium]
MQDEMHLSPRDTEEIRLLADSYTMSLDHLAIFLGRQAKRETRAKNRLSLSAVRQVVKDRWIDKYGYTEWGKLLGSTPHWVWPSEKGLRELNLSKLYDYQVPSYGALPHLHAINFVHLLVTGNIPDGTWVSERVLKRTERWDDGRHRPDAEWIHPNGGFTAIEIELADKGYKRVVTIIKNLLETYNDVWYFVSKEAEPAVTKAVDLLRPEYGGLNEESDQRVIIAPLAGYRYQPITAVSVYGGRR